MNYILGLIRMILKPLIGKKNVKICPLLCLSPSHLFDLTDSNCVKMMSLSLHKMTCRTGTKIQIFVRCDHSVLTTSALQQ